MKARRFWTYAAKQWKPAWYQKIGIPSFGADEWGRHTIVVGFGFLGYLAWAYRTCWADDCRRARNETLEMMAFSEADRLLWNFWEFKESLKQMREGRGKKVTSEELEKRDGSG